MDAYTVMLIAIALATPFFIFFGWLSDRIGRKPIILGGCLLAAHRLLPDLSGDAGLRQPDPGDRSSDAGDDDRARTRTCSAWRPWSSSRIVLVTMVYGPIAAFLVEFFPAKCATRRCRCPYHLGNGEFGGWLPFIYTAMVAAATAGGMFAGLAAITPGGATFVGLWYPIAVAVMSLIIGGLWIRETKDTRIWDEVGGRDEQTRAPAPPETAAQGGSLAG